jgi:N-acetylglucosamine kinase
VSFLRRFVLGVDGGGSKTHCVALDSSGRLLARGIGGPSNPLAVGFEAASMAILDAIGEASMRCRVERFDAACVAVAGVERPVSRGMLEERLRAALPAAQVFVVPDAMAALYGATLGEPGVVVIAGTGSIAYGWRDIGEVARAGGWGWKIGDEGSGYEIGRKALNAAARAHDGRGPKTLLLPLILEAFNLKDPMELIDLIYLEGLKPHRVATLTPLVVEAAEKDDQVARRILREAGAELARAAVAVVRRLGLEGFFTVSYTGGVFQESSLIRGLFEEEVKRAAPGCRVTPVRFEPAVGAAMLAFRKIGVEVDEAFLETLEASMVV